MAKRKPAVAKAQQRVAPDRLQQILWRTITAMVLVIPLAVSSSGKDLFNVPKDIVFRAGMILIVTALLIGWRRRTGLYSVAEWRRPPVLIAPAAVAWTAIAALVSSDRSISLISLAITAALAMFYLLSLRLAADHEVSAVWFLLVPALLNAGLVMMQESGIQPLNVEKLSYDPHLSTTGFLGNPNVCGTFLVGPTLAAVALAVVSRGRRRYAAMLAVAVLAAGILTSRTLTSMAALAAGVAVLVAVFSWRLALKLAVPALIGIVVFVMLYPPLWYRARSLIHSARTGEYNLLLTNRLTPFLAAGTMFADHPIFGIGPGTFGHHYFDYKIRAEERHPRLVTNIQRASWSFSFGEVHNDHLEVLAETGLPGYLIFLAALIVLSAGSVPGLDGRLEKLTGTTPPEATVDGSRHRFAAVLSLPLAASFFVVALAQFPLQLISTATAWLYLAALCRSWSRG